MVKHAASRSKRYSTSDGARPGGDEQRALEQTFNSLVAEWKATRGPSSDMSGRICSPSYLRIIGMGEPAIGLILKEMRREPDHWFVALYSITGMDAAAGEPTVPGAIAAWLNWGKARGYLDE